MPIIIDGWNFIRNKKSNVKDDEIESLEAVRRLISYLGKFQETHSDPMILVLDSSNVFLGIDYKNSEMLSVVPAKNADDYIKRYVDEIPQRQRRNVRVVSSDTDVYYYAKSSYATPIKCEEFWDKIKKTPSS